MQRSISTYKLPLTIKDASQQCPNPEQTHLTHPFQNDHTIPVYAAVSAYSRVQNQLHLFTLFS